MGYSHARRISRERWRSYHLGHSQLATTANHERGRFWHVFQSQYYQQYYPASGVRLRRRHRSHPDRQRRLGVKSAGLAIDAGKNNPMGMTRQRNRWGHRSSKKRLVAHRLNLGGQRPDGDTRPKRTFQPSFS
jgi:hypothetical protein